MKNVGGVILKGNRREMRNKLKIMCTVHSGGRMQPTCFPQAVFHHCCMKSPLANLVNAAGSWGKNLMSLFTGIIVGIESSLSLD